MASGGMEGLTPEAARSLVDSVDVFIFDCDGVIWKGDKLIEGVSEALHTLRSLGKRFVFVTNNSRKSRKQYAKKFSRLGMEIDEGEIFTSSFAAAMYLKLNNFPTDKKVYVVGEEGIKEELKLVGYESIGGPEDGRKSIQLESSFFFDHDRSVGAVVVGLDQHFNYYKLQYATLCIRENPGCLFIATNCDSSGNLTSLQEWPGAGCMVSAVSCSTQKEPVVVGKPSTFLMKFLLERFKIDVSRMCMVGDRLDTDILFGQNTGCKTLLVLSGYFAFLYQVSRQGVQIRCRSYQRRSYYGALYDLWRSHMDPGVGVTTLPALLDPSNSIYPDVYANNLSHFVQLSSL